MEKKILLKKFVDLKECQNFLNELCKTKNVLDKKVIPIAVSEPQRIIYFVLAEYFSKA